MSIKRSDYVNYNPVLKELEKGDIDSQVAYDQLFVPKVKTGGKRAYFVKMKMKVPEEGKGINTMFKVLFMIPFPLIFATTALRMFGAKIMKNIEGVDLDIGDLIEMIKYSKGTKIDIDAKDANIEIKVI